MRTAARRDIGLEEVRAFLADPRSYPERTSTVDVIETHMALVFLTEHHAYKLKKPVRHDYLDFRELESRRRVCREELRLNRRLAPDTYLGVVPVTAGAGGRLRISGPGRPVEWLVYMQRLPAERMLDAAMRGGTVSPVDLQRVAQRLADFYRRAPVDPVGGPDYCTRLGALLTRDAAALVRDTAYATAARTASAALHAFLASHADLFHERARLERIVEGHGDLRPEHICLSDPPVVIDCLEFEPAFRLVDPADELVFLALECEVADHPEVGARLVADTLGLLEDQPPSALLEFYKGARALLRARLALSHVRDMPRSVHPHWRERTRLYLELATRYARGLMDPTHTT